MGIFDFLRKKDPVKDEIIQLVPKDKTNIATNSYQSLVPFFGNLQIPENTRQL